MSFNPIPVSTAIPMVSDEELKNKGLMVLTVRKNGDKEKKIEAQNRSILIPEIRLGLREDGVSSKFVEYLRNSLYETAAKQFRELWDAAGNNFSEVPGNVWSVDSLLAYSAMQVESTRLTKESISAWFMKSVILQRIQQQQDPEKRVSLQKKYADAFVHISAPTMKHDLIACEDLKKKLEQFEDVEDSTIVRSMISRLNSRIRELSIVREQFQAEEF